MLYAILCYNDEDVVGPGPRRRTTPSWRSSTSCTSKLAATGQARARSARLLPTTAATTLRKGQRAAGARRPVRRDQGAAARLLRRRLRRTSTRRSTSRAISAKANPGGAYEIRPIGYFAAGSGALTMTDIAWIDAALTSARAPGGRRAAALFPRSRHRRGGLPGRLPARAEELAAERPAARSRRLADHGRPQRRASTTCGAASKQQAAAGRGSRSPISDDAESAAGRAARRRALPRRRPAAAVHLLPSRPAGDAADRAGAAHRLGPHGQADRARLPGRRERDGAAHHARQGQRRRGRRAVRDAGRGRARPSGSPRSRRWSTSSSTKAIRRAAATPQVRAPLCDEAIRLGAPAAAPVSSRAGDHGADRADAAAACARARRGFDADGAHRAARGPGPRAVEPQA